MIARRSASASWAKPTSALLPTDERQSSVRFSGTGSDWWANVPSGAALSKDRPAAEGLEESRHEDGPGAVAQSAATRNVRLPDGLDVEGREQPGEVGRQRVLLPERWCFCLSAGTNENSPWW